MITADDALGKVGQAESSGQVSGSAAAAIRRWLTESPFIQYRPRLLEDIAEGRWKALDDAFFTVLEFGTGGRRGMMYPVGTNVLKNRTLGETARGVAGGHERPNGPPQRGGGGGGARPRPAPGGGGPAAALRHRPRSPPQLARVRRAVRPGAGRGRVQGVPLPRGPVDSPALVRRAP